jgi:hypothetical protein
MYRSSTSSTIVSSSRWTTREATAEKEEEGELQVVLDYSSRMQVGVHNVAGCCESTSSGLN